MIDLGGGPGSLSVGSQSSFRVATTYFDVGTTVSIGSDVEFFGANVTSFGVVIWGAGDITLGDGTVFNNGNVFSAECDKEIKSLGTATFNNAGGFYKGDSPGSTLISVQFNNSGFDGVQVSSGLLALLGGGTQSEEFWVAQNACLGFGGGKTANLDAGTSFTGTGTVSIADGTLFVMGNVTTTFDTKVFMFEGGKISNAGIVQFQTDFTWQGGTLEGANQVIGRFDASGSVTIKEDAKTKKLENATFNNYALTVYQDTGELALSNSTWNNYNNFQIKNAASVQHLAGTTAFNNLSQGTVVKTDGTETSFNVSFTNNGILDLNGYDLSFTKTLTQSGAQAITTLSGGKLRFGMNALFELEGGYLGGGGTITGSLKNSGGIVRVGDNLDVRTLTVTGNYEQQAGGTLEVNISSYGEGKLAVTGTATVAGDVEVLLLGGYVPEEEASGVILTANGGASGEFDSATFVSGHARQQDPGVRWPRPRPAHRHSHRQRAGPLPLRLAGGLAPDGTVGRRQAARGAGRQAEVERH